MAEISLPVIVTAVADSDLEGFIAGTLYSQGWSVIYRALDAHSLVTFLEDHAKESSNVVLIYSPDLPGISPEVISGFQNRVKQVIGFSNNQLVDDGFIGVLAPPTDATGLISLLRGFVRAPLIRTQIRETSPRRRAKVIAIGSPAGSSGCTTVAINLAMELSVLGHETLLLDADVRRPSVAPLLSLHKLDSDAKARTVSTHLSVSEFRRDKVEELSAYLQDTVEKYDFLVIDLGAVEGLEDALTDRRWTSSLIHWSCDNADELWLIGRANVLGILRMENLVRDFTQITIRAKVSVLLNMRAVGRKGSDQESHFVTIAANLKPHRVFTLPKDAGAVLRAEEARTALIETNTRSPLRKAIMKLAVEITS